MFINSNYKYNQFMLHEQHEFDIGKYPMLFYIENCNYYTEETLLKYILKMNVKLKTFKTENKKYFKIDVINLSYNASTISFNLKITFHNETCESVYRLRNI